MPNYCEEPASLSEFHWLFSEELAEESLPLFIPRILSFGQSSNQSRPASPFRPAPRVRRDQSYDYEEAPSPNFDPENDASYFSIESGSAARNSSDPNSGPCPIPPPEALLSLRSATRKRHAEGTHEDDHRPQKYYRRSECQSSNIGYSSNSDASQSESQSRTPPSTASPALQCCGCQSDPSSLNFDQSLEIQHLRAQLAVSESRGANAIAELEASRTCVDFLLNEVRRVIDSGLGRQNPQKAQQIIRDTENRVQLFTRASRVTTQPSVHHTDSLPVFHSVLSEDLDPRNPHSYYFSQDSLALPLDPSQRILTPRNSPRSLASTPSNLSRRSDWNPRVAILKCPAYPLNVTFLPNRHPFCHNIVEVAILAGQLMQEWNHARLDSYINLYFAEPLPSVNTFQEPPQNLAQPYQMSTNVLI
ncbi:hypothetical protein PSTT_08467 [Puccinia striiformis]|uniref:Uncharacterized protein n=1 Tax=Puccinia striiformis TaxID=27350 RepID=A0A2S4VCE5_9BASI|nr:hypothetical protein PSTT_08467 [Puccinia striiformis]